jgi:hypothetical protein
MFFLRRWRTTVSSSHCVSRFFIFPNALFRCSHTLVLGCSRGSCFPVLSHPGPGVCFGCMCVCVEYQYTPILYDQQFRHSSGLGELSLLVDSVDFVDNALSLVHSALVSDCRLAGSTRIHYHQRGFRVYIFWTLSEARSRLYRSQNVQVNTKWSSESS